MGTTYAWLQRKISPLLLFSVMAITIVLLPSNNIAILAQSQGTTIRVSVASNGTQGNSTSSRPSISSDGRFVAFESIATNLVSGDTNGVSDVFVYDGQTRITSRVSIASDGTQGNSTSYKASISSDGRFVAFESIATNLVSGPSNWSNQIYVHDRQTGQTTCVSVNSNGIQGNSMSGTPSISANGRFVTFDSMATNLVDGDTNNTTDIFVHDQQTRQTSRASVASNGTQSDGNSSDPSISADGRFVAFSSAATNLVSGDTNGITNRDWGTDIFIHDQQTGQTIRISVASDGSQAIPPQNTFLMTSYLPSISSDGRYVAFGSFAANLVNNDTNNSPDIFVHDQQTGETSRVSVTSSNNQVTGSFSYSDISADGRFVVFTSDASDLVNGDTNGKDDIFIHDRQTGQTNRISVASDNTQANDLSLYLSISSDGRYVAFLSTASNLVSDDTNNAKDVFVRDQGAGGASTDMGFRPQPDGYQFCNAIDRPCDSGWSRYPASPANSDFHPNDLRTMFGDAAVCQSGNSTPCNVRPEARTWLQKVNESMNDGHCLGMAVTSLRFFKHQDSPSAFQTGVNTTYGLFLGNARRNIAYYHVQQYVPSLESVINNALRRTLGETIDVLRSALSPTAPDPAVLFITEENSGHAVTPYALEDRGNGVYSISVYDNNWPNDSNRFISINTTANVWSYNTGNASDTSTLWTGNSNALGVIPISWFLKAPQHVDCPWCATQTSGQIWFSGLGTMVIVDPQGHRMGTVDGQVVREIPLAYAMTPLGGLQSTSEPIYTIPLTETDHILLNGRPLTQTETVDLTQFGPGFAVSVSQVPLNTTTQDQIVIAPDGTQIRYQANETKTLNLTVAHDTADANYQFQIQRADVGASQTIVMEMDGAKEWLTFSNAQAGGGTYDLQIERTSDAGVQRFGHLAVTIANGDTEHIDYGAWTGSGSMILLIDHGSDGTIDQTVTLENQAGRVYLPFIRR